MSPEAVLEVKAPQSALAPIAPTKSASRIWRIVGLVVAVQIVVVLAFVVLFSGMGFATDGVGSCGGG
jgi:hypothetical protein